MAIQRGPDIVENGLILAYDAGNINSYMGTGGIIYNLVNNTSQGTFVVFPTASLDHTCSFSSENYGAITFSGSFGLASTGSYVAFTSSNMTTTATIEMWAKIDSLNIAHLLGFNSYGIYCLSGRVGFNTFNSDIYGIPPDTSSALGMVGNWKQYVFEMHSDISYTNNKFYVNSQLQPLEQVGVEKPISRTFNSNRIRLGTCNGINYFANMSCSIFKMYNRALTQDEVNQLYDAHKTRFGLT
jgi:hypothetical protein